MTPTPRDFALLLVVAGAAAAVAVAPIAVADPVGTPEAGSESADATISDLKAQGYNVRINWVSGTPDIPAVGVLGHRDRHCRRPDCLGKRRVRRSRRLTH